MSERLREMARPYQRQTVSVTLDDLEDVLQAMIEDGVISLTSPGHATARSLRARAANLVNGILHDLGALSAVVGPRGPLRDQVDDETEHIAALAEAIGRDFRPR